MPTVWLSLRKSLQCKSEPSDVYDPKGRGAHHLGTILTKKSGRSGCSRSIANLKDFLNPITHEVILSNSTCELKITGLAGAAAGSTFVGMLRPGTPGPGGSNLALHRSPSFRTSVGTSPRKFPVPFTDREGHVHGGSFLSNAVFGNGGGAHQGSSAVARASIESDSHVSAAAAAAAVICHKCGEQFGKWEAAEAHHLSKHAVTELVEGDSSRKIVEIICRTSWSKAAEGNSGRIERVLKVHNMQRTLARFEEYREMVKLKASKLAKKHPRCLADGNELLRFYGTTVACSLGASGSSSLCAGDKCSVCRIIRRGFTVGKGGVGVFTTSTSTRAFESVETYDDDLAVRKALLVCRVIAGRVHRPLDNFEELAGQTGFDSLAGKVGLYANIEELYLLNPQALLPCFVVICKP
ncbi:unnamed protein product [Spirodela intermedia]|uniref:C2H2-type domain-containing protein n=1 Tax=Spirodela intermedia TaxID=51605 RepID=A0A7I8IFE5_SPIIN|nr:unnamed protein product [Spirodela intermedia]CAA6656530.1 unnamed protein product [Spirodela intermedia]